MVFRRQAVNDVCPVCKNRLVTHWHGLKACRHGSSCDWLTCRSCSLHIHRRTGTVIPLGSDLTAQFPYKWVSGKLVEDESLGRRLRGTATRRESKDERRNPGQ